MQQYNRMCKEKNLNKVKIFKPFVILKKKKIHLATNIMYCTLIPPGFNEKIMYNQAK